MPDEAQLSTQTDESAGEPVPFEGVPFDPDFFCNVLPGRVGALCPGSSKNVPVVLMHLVDGTTLDVCHIAQFTRHWIAVAAFRSTPSCEQMDIEFVPYATIHRVTVSVAHESERTIGFRPDHSGRAAGGEDGVDPLPQPPETD